LQLLKRELAMHDTLANRSQVNYDPLSEQQRSEIRDQVKAYMDGKSQDIDVCDRVHFFHTVVVSKNSLQQERWQLSQAEICIWVQAPGGAC